MAENRELALVLKLVAENFQSELKKSGGMLGEFNKFISDWKTQLVAAGGALFAIAKSTANYGDELVKTSQKMGTTIEDTARLQHAANLAGLDLQQLAHTVGFLSKEMFSASTGNVEAKRTFELLGVATTTSNGNLKGTKEMLVELGDKFRMMPEGPEKTALAMLALGKTGKDVLPLLNSNLREAFEASDRLGLTMDSKAAKAAEHFNHELINLQGAIKGVSDDVGTLLIPKFDAFAHALTTIITDARAVAIALSHIPNQPTIGVVRPKEGGRDLLILPNPEGIDQAITGDPFFQTPEQAQLGKQQEAKGRAIIAQASAKWNEDHAKAILDIWLSGNRALEIRNQLQFEENDKSLLAVAEEEAHREHLGEMIVHQTGLEVKIRDEARHEEQQGLIDNAQAWVAYYDQLGGNTQEFLAHKTDLLRAQLAKELDLSKVQSSELLAAWQQRDSVRADQILAVTPKSGAEKEALQLNTVRQDILNTREASGDFFAGWTEGMRKYVKDTQSGFGLAADMARRTAQLMESSFKTFFFDAMDGKIQSFKDVLRSLVDFTKQIVSQIASQLVTNQILRAITGAGGDLSASLALSTHGPVGSVTPAAMGGQVVRRFAMGGSVPGFGNQDSVPAQLTPGEVVLSRRDVSDIKGGLGGGISMPITIINQMPGAEIQATPTVGANGVHGLKIMITQIVSSAIGEGRLDKSLAQRYQMRPQA